MTLRPTAAAMQLFLEGQIALSEVEHNGCRVDRDYALAKREELRERIRDYEARMRADELYKDWRKRFGDKTNVGSPEQLAEVIFKVKGHRSPRATGKKGRASAAESALETVDEPFLKNLYLPCQKLRKALGTYLEGILREAVQHEDGHWYVHPHYNLNTVESFRSSCSEPNYQNNPSRNPEIGEIVRRCYVPRPGHQILEIDYSQIEVRTWCAYHKDRTMIDYVRDPSKDMHRDMAAQIFFLEPKQVSKELRSHVKNKFVFPSFYGSYYVQTAPSLWEALERFGLKVEGSGATVREHLAARGITHRGACDPDQEPRPGTFEARMREIEEDFWGRRFAGVTAWKREWIEAYYRDGGCRFLTGFVMRGPHKRNDIINYSNQGCLAGTARVLTADGLVPIRELVGKSVKVWTGFRWADAVGLDRGRWNRARITLSSGLVIECDTRHKLKNERDEWVEYKDLRVGDCVALPRCGDVVDPSPDVTWPFVYGFVIGDGHLDENDGSIAITGGESKKDDLLRIRRFLVSQGFQDGGAYRGIRWREIPPTEGRTQTRYCLSLDDRDMERRLKDAGFDFSWRAATKRVPDSVWRLPVQGRRDFLEGLWRSDGSRHEEQKGNLHMCNEGLLREVQVLAAGLGYDSHLTRTDSGFLLRFSSRKFWSKAHRRYPATAIRIHVDKVRKAGYEDGNQYITDHRNHGSGKDVTQYVGERILERNSSAPVYRFDRIVSIEELGFEETTYTMSVDDPLHQFVADGVVHKNTAFHCLLWSLIKIQNRLRQYKFRTRVIGEVHDSMNFDAHPAERDDVIDLSVRVMTEEIKKWAPWLNVPLAAEPEACPVDASWFDKAALVEKGGVWVPASPEKWEKKYGPWERQIVA